MKSLLLFLIFIVFTNISFAEEQTIAILSSDIKNIIVRNIDTQEITYLNNSEVLNNSYNNFEVTFVSSTDKLTNKTLISNIRNLSDNRYDIIWLAIFCAIAVMSYGWIKSR